MKPVVAIIIVAAIIFSIAFLGQTGANTELHEKVHQLIYKQAGADSNISFDPTGLSGGHTDLTSLPKRDLTNLELAQMENEITTYNLAEPLILQNSLLFALVFLVITLVAIETKRNNPQNQSPEPKKGEQK